MVKTASVIVDDQSSEIEYLCPSNHQSVGGGYFNGTWSTVQSSSCGSNGWFRHTFNGTGVRVFVSASDIMQYTATIDGGPALVLSGYGYFESPALTDGEHTLTYATADIGNAPAFDYLAVSVGNSTPLTAQTFIVDDTDDSIEFQGNWSNQIPAYVHEEKPILSENTTKWSSSIGDKVQFHFYGTSVSVYGKTWMAMPNASITASYSFDNSTSNPTLINYTVDELETTKVFHADMDMLGNHTLFISINNISPSQAYGIDFFTYSAVIPQLDLVTFFSTASPAQVRNSHKGAIVGGSVAVSVLILAMIIAFVVSRQSPENKWGAKRRRGHSADSIITSNKRTPGTDAITTQKKSVQGANTGS